MVGKKTIIIATALLVAAIIISSFVYLSFQKPYSGNIESVTIGVLPSEYISLIYIANDQQYFQANGLQVTIKNYTTGASSVNGMLNGEADIATASEFVVANNALQNKSIYALGTVSKYINLYIVARTDAGINHISDLAGKRIGVAIGTANQFYLGRFLELNGVQLSQVTLVNVGFAQTPTALANGTIDATIIYQPYIKQIQDLLGDKAVVWPAQADQFGYFEAISTKEWVNSHSDLAIRFSKAMVQAENFNIAHKDQAMEIVAKALNNTISFEQLIMSDFQYTVTLDQSFIVLMQDEAKWLIDNNLTNSTANPNFTNYIYTDALNSAKPGAVNIIG